jgi:very-short-patch-repair endonuclease
VATLAAAQHGVVSAKQLAERGFSRKSIGAEVAGGRLHRIHRGVYAVGHTELTHYGRVMAAVLANAPAIASHWTAGWLWGLFRTNSAIHLTAPTRRHRRSGFRVHFAALALADLGTQARIPVTSLARTLLDLAPLVDAKRLGRLLETAEKLEDDEGRKPFDLREFHSLLARTPHHSGHGPLRRALRLYRPELATLRSNLERDFHALLRGSSLPLPGHNVNVGPYELDCYWPEHRFCVELDVYSTHGSRRSFEADREREDDLLLRGIEVMRVTDVRLGREPEAVLARVAAHLERRRQILAFN